jgi:hypothetical protein
MMIPSPARWDMCFSAEPHPEDGIQDTCIWSMEGMIENRNRKDCIAKVPLQRIPSIHLHVGTLTRCRSSFVLDCCTFVISSTRHLWSLMNYGCRNMQVSNELLLLALQDHQERDPLHGRNLQHLPMPRERSTARTDKPHRCSFLPDTSKQRIHRRRR